MSISRDDLIGVWAPIAGGGYFELRPDGSARRKIVGRGGSGDFAAAMNWSFDGGSFTVHFLTDDPWYVRYRIVRHHGSEMELTSILFGSLTPNGLGTDTVADIEVWKRVKPPKSWRDSR